MAALFCEKSRHGRRLDSMTSNRKSDSVSRRAGLCIYPKNIIFCQISSRSDLKSHLKRQSLRLFDKSLVPTTTTTTTRWVAIWDQFLIQNVTVQCLVFAETSTCLARMAWTWDICSTSYRLAELRKKLFLRDNVLSPTDLLCRACSRWTC